MITTRKEANPNYLAKIVRLRGVRKHTNADRLQCVDIDFQTVVTGMDAKDGDIYVFFPVESKINYDFLATTNSFRDYTLNKAYIDGSEDYRKTVDDEKNKSERQVGFFEDSCRVRATRLRGEKSMGYIVPIATVKEFTGDFNEDNYINMEFDTINGILMVEKYEVKPQLTKKNNNGKSPKVRESRLIEGQVRLHNDTQHLVKNIHRISPFNEICITNKTHGTSWWVGNLKVRKPLTLGQKIAKFFGVAVQDTEYDFVYGSRKVVKNDKLGEANQKNHYYGYDLWEDIKDQVKDYIPKGFTLYGEALGYTKTGAEIQKGYDYGCKEGEMKLEVYKITFTNEDGMVTVLSPNQVTQFCESVGLTRSKVFHIGKAYWMLPHVDVNHPQWGELFIQELREEFTEKDCTLCVNKVPEEGIVVWVEDMFEYAAFKLKSFRFLEWETKSLDRGEVADLEDRVEEDGEN